MKIWQMVQLLTVTDRWTDMIAIPTDIEMGFLWQSVLREGYLKEMIQVLSDLVMATALLRWMPPLRSMRPSALTFWRGYVMSVCKEMWFKIETCGIVWADSTAFNAGLSGMGQTLVRNQLCTWLECVWERDGMEGVWVWEGRVNRRLSKIA